MRKRLIAVASILANLTVTIGAREAFASFDFKVETPTAATPVSATPVAAPAKHIAAKVSVNAQIAPQINSSLSQFEKFGMRCFSSGKTAIPALVTEVVSGSPAYRKGLQSGDGIVALKVNTNSYSLTIDRNGKLYSVSLSAFDLASNSALNSRTALSAAALQAAAVNNPVLNLGANRSDVVMPVSQTIAASIDEHPFINAIARDRHSGVVQGALPNCWFEASLSAVADSPRGPEILSHMITLSTQAYLVKFPNCQTITVTDGKLASANLSDPAKWAAIFELAETEVYPDNSPSRGAAIGNPGVKVGLELLTGKPVSFVRPDSLSIGELSDLLDRMHSQGQPVTVASKSPAEHRQRIQPVMPNHAYSLVDFDRNAGLVTLRNPLGYAGSSDNGLVRVVAQDEIQVDVPTLATFFRFVAYPD